jgi:trimeric autotransporter adhesin
VDGLKGTLFKDWTMVAKVTVGSGLPLTPVYLVPSSGTGVTGAVRASLTGISLGPVDDGRYANPLAYGPPAPGTWGTAGRNSITGPAQYSVDAGVGRTFRMKNRMSLDWRFDATNVLNQVTFSSVNMLVGSPLFGLPNRANQMRRLQSSARLRF